MMYEVHGSVQTFTIRNGQRRQLSSRPVWFRFSRYMPDNTRTRQPGSTEWQVTGDYVISTVENATRMAKIVILGDNSDSEHGEGSFITEATITVREFDPAEQREPDIEAASGKSAGLFHKFARWVR